MNLARMSLPELAAFRGQLACIEEAAGLLAQADLVPEICLTDGGTIIRAAPLIQLVPALPAAKAPVAAPKVPVTARKPAVVPAKPATYVSGPLSDAEKAIIRDMSAAGDSASAIAARLDRRSATISLYLARKPKAAKTTAAPASAPPVKLNPPPAPAALTQASLSPPERGIWQHFAGLKMPSDWSIRLDLDICEALGRGSKAHEIALDLGLDPQRIITRYKEVTAPVRDDMGRIRPDEMARFMKVLRLFATDPQGKAA